MSDKIFPLTPNLTLIAKGKVLDKRTGSIVRIDNLKQYGNDPAINEVLREIFGYLHGNNVVLQNIDQKAEVVSSIDVVDIDFYLKTSDGEVESKAGFLVEVFDSGSNGVLTKLYQEDLKDPLDENKTLEDGFSNYFILELDP